MFESHRGFYRSNFDFVVFDGSWSVFKSFFPPILAKRRACFVLPGGGASSLDKLAAVDICWYNVAFGGCDGQQELIYKVLCLSGGLKVIRNWWGGCC